MLKFLHKKVFVDRHWPNPDVDQRKLFRRMAHQLFIAGTLGAMFTTVARNIPDVIKEISLHPQLDYTLDRFLRWAYFLWFVVYFFVSNVGLDRARQKPDHQIDPHDTKYYVFQCIAALAAAYFLGFLVSNTQFENTAYVVSNVALAGICGLALRWYADDNNAAITGVNLLRFVGLLVSLGALLAIALEFRRTIELGVLLFLQIVMWIILLLYRRVRLDV